jgi:2-oxoglutarate dehydrogenase E2 component (dihydrolipoamide succinyltransferase)
MSIIDIKVPTIGESVTEVTLSSWLVEEGAIVKMDQPLCEFESDKATLELPAEAAGKITRLVAEGTDLAIGDILATIDTSVTTGDTNTAQDTASSKVAVEKTEAKAEPTTTKPSEESYAKGTPSPAADKILKEKNISTDQVQGTGVGGRITKADAEKASPQVTVEKTTEEIKSKESGKTFQAFSRNERKEKMSRLRRTIATRLVSAKNNTAMLTTFNEVDMSGIMNLRKKYQDAFVKKYGIKLGFMSLFSKACATVLMEMPEVNAFIEGDSIIYHDFVDISIAISVPNGLVVPPIHNVESLSLAEIEYKVKELADRAREGKLTLEEMKGGTFTVTNGGIFGSMMSTPIINEPQSAILGMHAIIDRPVAINGQVEIRPMMYIAMSYDHRIIDGSSSVTFLVKVKELLEDPTKLFLGL